MLYLGIHLMELDAEADVLKVRFFAKGKSHSTTLPMDGLQGILAELLA